MLKAVAIVAACLAVAIVAVLIYASTKPDTFHVARATLIKAPADKIFPLINNLGAQSSWSPFEKDPNMKRVLSGPQSGKGATYEWDGNWEVGKGRIVVTESTPSTKVTLALDMIKPFDAHNIVEFTLASQEGATLVTWSMRGPQPLLAKVVSTFFNCEKMVGDPFEEGLGKLKALAEK